MHKNSHIYGQRFRWIPGERRLIFSSAEDRRITLGEAESTEGVLQKKKQDPEKELLSHTERLAGELKRINDSWLNTLTFRRKRLAKHSINDLAEQKLRSEYKKFNGWLYRTLHWGERRMLLARAREQTTKDVLGYLHHEKNDILTFKSRFARAASFIGKHKVPVSAKELKRTQNLEKLLGPLQHKYGKKSSRHSGALEWMEGARETEELIRTQLLHAGLKEESIQVLLDDNTGWNSSLMKEIRKHFSGDQRRKLGRAARRLRRYGRYRLLHALSEDINALPPKERLEKINTDTARSRILEFDLRGKRFRTTVLSRKSPYLTLLDLAKGRKGKDAYMVIDTRDGVLLRKEEGKEREHDMIRNKDNIFKVPSNFRAA